MKKIGFIGMGNMAKALASGFISSGMVAKEDVYAFAPHQEKLKKNSQEIGFTPCSDVETLVKSCDTIFMACKPYQIEVVLAQVKEQLKGKALVSVAINWDFEKYAQYVDPSTRVQYIMPNTPARVAEGVFLMETEGSLTKEEEEQLRALLGAIGTVVDLPGDRINAGSAITGCGPAFVNMMMEAMADAAVKHGIPRADAYKMVAQMVIGTGKLLLESGEHPGALKDAVCSPGGTTIRGVIALEHAGMRAAFMDAVDAAAAK